MTNSQRADSLDVEKCKDGWWIVNHNPYNMGPYDTKAEAMEDLRGVRNFYKHHAIKDPEADALEDILS